MSDICTKIVDGDHNPPIAQKAESEYIMISSKNVVNDSIIHLDDVRHLSRADFELSNARTQVSKGDVLFTSVASLGRTCIYDLDYPITFQRSVTVICTKIFNRYLKLFLDSPLYQNYVGENARGTAQKGFYINQISDSWVPIPPLNEQIRIVEKAQSLLDIVQIINYSKEETSNNIIALKSKILDLAISGKLVRQDKSDEPAIELLKRINPQYQPTDNRHYENVPFDLPKTWQLTKLKDLCIFLSRGKSPKYSETDKTYPVFAQKCNLKDGGISLEHARFLDPTTVSKWKDVYKLQDGDILINSTGTGTVCRTRLFKTRYLNNYPCVVPDSHVSVIRLHKLISPEYAYIVLSSNASQSYMMDNLAGSTNQKELYISVLENLIFPVPPIEEQRRIVYIIKKISEYIDKIAAAL